MSNCQLAFVLLIQYDEQLFIIFKNHYMRKLNTA